MPKNVNNFHHIKKNEGSPHTSSNDRNMATISGNEIPGLVFKANRCAFKTLTPSITICFHLQGGQSRSVAATQSSLGFDIKPYA